MPCKDIHINVQDAAGDRVLAGDMLKKEPTDWKKWIDKGGLHALGSEDGAGRHEEGFGEEHVHDIVGSAGKKQTFGKTPGSYKPWGKAGNGNACRVYGSLEVNKVQGDFHITARGHGYMDWQDHLDHKSKSLPFPPSFLLFLAFA